MPHCSGDPLLQVPPQAAIAAPTHGCCTRQYQWMYASSQRRGCWQGAPITTPAPLSSWGTPARRLSSRPLGASSALAHPSARQMTHRIMSHRLMSQPQQRGSRTIQRRLPRQPSGRLRAWASARTSQCQILPRASARAAPSTTRRLA